MSVGMRMPLAKLYGMRRENTVTLKPRESATVLLNSIQRFFSERKLTDAKLVYHDKELFSCHKAVLSAFSSYFETLLAGTENCTVLSLDAVNPDNVEDLKYILQYMYGHTVTLHRNRVQHLLESAKIFGVTALHKTLEAQLVREMTHSQEQIGSTTGHSGKKKPPKPQSNNITVKPTAVASILLVSFQRFKSEQKFLDAKILAADVQLHTAHKLVLAAYSRYFESLLETTETLAILNLDEVDSVHVDLLKEILLYMYGHQVEIKESQIDSLISAARIFGVTSLSDGELSRIATKLRSGGTNLQSNSSGNATIYYQPSLGSVLQQNSVVEKPNRPVRSDYNFARTEPAAPSPPVSETSITGESQKETAKPIVLSSPIPSVMSRSLPLLTSVTNTSRIGFYSMSSPSFSLSSGIDESLTLANVSDSFAMEEVIGGDETSPNSLYDTDHMIGSDIIGSEVYITEEAESSLTNQQTSQPMQECLSVLLKEEEIDDRLEYPVLSCNPNLLTTDSNKLDFEIDSFADVGVLSGFRPCPLCGRAIKDGNCKPLMESHLRQHHRQPLSTPETDGGHSRLNGATTTAVVKKPNWLSCTDCDKYYKTARTLLKHAKLCHHDQRDKLCCISCHIVFQNDSALQTHMRTSHKRSSHLENTSDPSLLMEFGLDPHNSSQIESFDEAKFSSEEDGPLQVESSTGLISPITRPSIDLVNGVEDGEYLSDGGQESCSYPSDLDSSTDKPSVSATSSASVKRKRNLSGPQQQKKKQPRIQVIRTGSTLNVNPIVSCPELSNHVCVRCEPSISFIGKAEYLNHCEREHNLQIFRCTKCKKIFKTAVGLRQHYDSHRNTVLRCIKCGFETKSRSNLSLHLRKEHKVTITGAKMKPRFQCAVCGQKFVYECLLNNHVRSKHSAEKPFKCPFCEYGATEKGALKTHIRSIHAKEKPFKCNMCDQAFTTSSILARHKRTHTGELPHKCAICDERFSEKRNLTAHHLKVHERSRPFKCDRCPMAFFRKDFLGAHMKRHGVLPY